MHGTQGDARDSFVFQGNLRDFARIAFVNLLLTILTLGVYSFWGSTRVRRYLWANTRFIDDHLEWTGTGRELFLGFLAATLFVLLPFYALNFALQSAMMRGQPFLAVGLGIAMFVAIFYLIGVAHFRMLRYRLSRTLWRGIRGGSDDGGWRYGAAALARGFLLWITLMLTLPGYNIALWNRRWGAMSFGPHAFRTEATTKGLYRRFWALIGLSFLAVAAIGIVAMSLMPVDARLASIVSTVLSYMWFAVIGMLYLAIYLRNAIDGLSLGGLEFRFEADSEDWLKFLMGNLLLVVATLGLGVVLLPFRNWQFLITHLGATGHIHADELTQSPTRAPGEGEGLAGAFEIGAI